MHERRGSSLAGSQHELIYTGNSMSIQGNYDDWSATYDVDVNRTRDLDRAALEATLGSFHFRSILEPGCGTGKNTSFLSQIGEHVCGFDFSKGMLKKAQSKPGPGSVDHCMADVTRAWPFSGQAFDLVTCDLLLEHVENLAVVFKEAWRTLRKDGMLFICELHPERQALGIKARFQKGEERIEIPAYVHQVQDFTREAEKQSFALKDFKEWREAGDDLPRLAAFLFLKT